MYIIIQLTNDLTVQLDREKTQREKRMEEKDGWQLTNERA